MAISIDVTIKPIEPATGLYINDKFLEFIEANNLLFCGLLPGEEDVVEEYEIDGGIFACEEAVTLQDLHAKFNIWAEENGLTYSGTLKIEEV